MKRICLHLLRHFDAIERHCGRRANPRPPTPFWTFLYHHGDALPVNADSGVCLKSEEEDEVRVKVMNRYLLFLTWFPILYIL